MFTELGKFCENLLLICLSSSSLHLFETHTLTTSDLVLFTFLSHMSKTRQKNQVDFYRNFALESKEKAFSSTSSDSVLTKVSFPRKANTRPKKHLINEVKKSVKELSELSKTSGKRRARRAFF